MTTAHSPTPHTEFNAETVKYLAGLVRLGITEAEAEAFGQQLSVILDYFTLLAEAPVADVPPASNGVLTRAQVRADVAHPSLAREDFLANAPAVEGAYVRIASVLDVAGEGG